MVHADTKQSAALEVIDAPRLTCGSYIHAMHAVKMAVNKIDHPGVMSILDVGTLADGRPYVVTEPFHGTTLCARIADAAPSVTEAVDILLEICDVLIAAHADGVVHCTLELEHVVLLDRGRACDGPRVTLIDWGLSQAIDDEAWSESRDVAPAPSPTVDVYALGVIAHQLLVPIPAELQALSSAMLAEDPADRPTIDEVAKRLAELTSAQDDPAVPPFIAEGALESVRALPFKRRGALFAAACAAPVLYFFLGNHAPSVSPPPAPKIVIAEPPVLNVAPVPAPAPPPPAPPVVARPRAKAKPVDDERVLQLYQRVNNALLTFEQQFGTNDELSERFNAIEIEAATATPAARKATIALLDDLQGEIQRAHVEQCESAPDAAGCK